MRQIILKMVKEIIRFFSFLFWFFPIDPKKIFLLNFDGSIIGHDAKAIAIWAKENRPQYRLFWGLKTKKEMNYVQLNNVHFIKIYSLKGVFQLLTASTIVCNINPPFYLAYRKQQKIINVWHGFIGKKVGKYVKGYNKKQFALATCFLSQTRTNTMNIRDAFEYEGKILECGVPRNDIFFSASYEEVIYNTKKTLNIIEKKIVLYAPTFREQFLQANYTIDFEKLKQALENRFGGDWVILIKTHPMIGKKTYIEGNGIIDVSKYEDTQELLCCADILITDFSSVFWDFSLSYKPVFLYFDDIEEYGKDRGFLFSVYDLPFLIAQSNDELYKNIVCFKENEYIKRVKKFQQEVGNFENGHACEMLFKYIEGEI